MAKQLHKGDESSRRANIITASRTGDAKMLPQLLARLEANETHENRRHIVRALGNIPDPKAEMKLLQLLESEKGLMLGDIAHSLGQLKSRQAIPLLEQLADHTDLWVRQNATFALRRIRGES
jgi:HEAT repeat protein